MYIKILIFTIIITTINGLSKINTKPRGFEFPDGSQADGGLQDRQVLNGTIPGLVIPSVPINPSLPITPIVSPTALAQSYFGYLQNGSCVCVPTGRCTTNNTNTISTDGSGQIDIRIVTNLLPPPSGTNVTVPAIVTPSTCQATILERCCSLSPYQCGVRYPPVIGSRASVAGQADFGEYPWQAVLLGPGDVYAGSGALIDNYHVITAAHRVRDYAISGRVLKVRLGEWDASSTTEPIAYQDFIVARIFIHPSFNPVNLKNDIAIVRLSTQVVLGTTPTITTACLPATSFSGSRCWVAGWGKNDFSNNGAYQAIQKEVDVPVLQSSQCQTALAATRLGPTFVFDNQSFVCAGGEIGKDACSGDGGSPLMCQLGNSWFVVGLVAWGIGCATGGVPGVYVNVASYVSWIQTTVRS